LYGHVTGLQFTFKASFAELRELNILAVCRLLLHCIPT